MKDLLNIEDGYSVKIIMLKGEKGDKGDNGDAGDYSDLINKPQINNIELVGNILASDLGLASVGSVGQVDGRVTQLSQEVSEDIGQVNNNFATIESSFVAENAYSVGEYMVIYGQLYCATSAIAIGDTMDESTNIEVVSVGEKLTELENELTTVDSRVTTVEETVANIGSISNGTALTYSYPSTIPSSIALAEIYLNKGVYIIEANIVAEGVSGDDFTSEFTINQNDGSIKHLSTNRKVMTWSNLAFNEVTIAEVLTDNTRIYSALKTFKKNAFPLEINYLKALRIK